MNRRFQRTIYRAFVREQVVDSFDRGTFQFRSNYCELHVNTLDDEHAVFVLDFTACPSLDLAVLDINLARCQRTGESAQQSTSRCRYNIVEGSCVGFAEFVRRHAVMLRDCSMSAEIHRVRFSGQMSNPQRARNTIKVYF